MNQPKKKKNRDVHETEITCTFGSENKSYLVNLQMRNDFGPENPKNPEDLEAILGVRRLQIADSLGRGADERLGEIAAGLKGQRDPEITDYSLNLALDNLDLDNKP